MSSEHVEVLRHMKETVTAIMPSEVAAIDAAIASLSAQQPPAEAQAVAWSTDKPKHAGVYGVRGFNLDREPEDQFEAIVSVRLVDGELLCNLHESTSQDDFSWWTRVEDCSEEFEWIEFLPATAPPSAPVGVEGLQRYSMARGSDGERWSVYMDPDPAGEWVKWADAQMAALTAALAQKPAADGEEIMVNAAHDVYTLPLQPSGLSSGPRFVVHVPAPEQQPEARGARIARRRDVRLWMRHNAGFYDTATELAEAADDVFRLPDGALDNETHWVWDEAVEAINDAQREERS